MRLKFEVDLIFLMDDLGYSHEYGNSIELIQVHYTKKKDLNCLDREEGVQFLRVVEKFLMEKGCDYFAIQRLANLVSLGHIETIRKEFFPRGNVTKIRVNKDPNCFIELMKHPS